MKKILLALTLLLLLTSAPSAAAASTGKLDRSFGEGGRAATATPLGSFWGFARIDVASAPDGSTVVAPDHRVFRYQPDGQLDASFGSDGSLVLDEVEGLELTIYDVAVDDQGRILLFAAAVEPGPSIIVPGYMLPSVRPTYVAVLRLDPSGNLDPSFGGGDGIFRSDLGLRHEQEGIDGSRPPLVRSVAGTVDSGSRPVLVAASQEWVTGPVGHSYLDWAGRIVVRLTESGELDASFDDDGVVLLNSDRNWDIALGNADEPIVWGEQQITAVTGNGKAQSSFGEGGTITLRGRALGATVDHAGRLLVLESPLEGNRTRVLRFTAAGIPDPRFGSGGGATVDLPPSATAGSLAVDAENRALVVGSQLLLPRRGPSTKSVVVGRLTDAGKPDRSFGRHGWIRTGFGSRTRVASAGFATASDGPSGPQAVIDPKGRLIVADAAHSPALDPAGVVLARYRWAR